MPLRDHFRPPVSTQCGWPSIHMTWAVDVIEQLNGRLLPDGYRAEGEVSPATNQSFDLFEVRILDSRSGRPLVAAIEFVSPGNKDRDDARSAFVSKISDLLHTGIVVVVVDIVTHRSANLHNELVAAMNLAETYEMRPDDPPYLVSYAPFRSQGGGGVNCWPNRLFVGEPIPETPLALRGGPILRLDLESAYESACRKNRLV